MSDGTVEDVHRYLRYLLDVVGLTEEPWFWYAEACVYAEPQEWKPLLGRRCRDYEEIWLDIATETQPQNWRDTYKRWAEKVGAPEKYLSIVNAIHDQFMDHSRGIIEPVCGLFILSCKTKDCGGCLYEGLVRYADNCDNCDVPYFSYLPASKKGGCKHYKKRYCDYNKDIRDEITIKINDEEKYIYPEHALVISLPLFVVDGGVPRLLAMLILICESDENRTNGDKVEKVRTERLLDISTTLGALQERASVELARRYHGVIDGYYTGEDAVTLLAHPAWTTRDRIALLQREARAHTGDEITDQGLGDCDKNGKPLANITDLKKDRYVFERVFKQGVKAYRENPKCELDHAALALWEYQRGNELTDFLSTHLQNQTDAKSNYGAFCTAIHLWLKALYCHRSEQQRRAVAPTGMDYALQYYHLPWLAALAERAGGGACQCWFLHEGNPTGTFAFPVLPGARFLLPWLAMLAGWKAKGYEVRSMIVAVANEATNPKKHLKAFREWIQKEETKRQRDELGPFCALLALCIDRPDQEGEGVRDAVSGWRRALYQPNRRRGDDTGPIEDVLTCNPHGAMRGVGLPVDPHCGLFQPIDTAGLLDLDIENVKVGERDAALVAFSWPYAIRMVR